MTVGIVSMTKAFTIIITCKFGGGPVWSHDRIVDGWCELFRELSLHYKREERDRYVNNQNRPDIVL